MKTNYRFFTFHFPLFLVCALLPSLAFAQRVTFESTEEYRSLGAYDTWEQSPFRTGVLNGSNYVGGIVGNITSGKIDQCVAQGSGKATGNIWSGAWS